MEFGLPSNFVQACVTDSVGYLWLATKKGLCRYDGYNFKTITNISGNIVSLCKNNNNIVYYDNNKGLAAFNPYTNNVQKIAATQFDDADPYNDHYNNVFTDSKGRIWCSDFANVKYINPNTKQAKNFVLSNYNNSSDRLATFTQTQKNSVWIASIFGLQIFNEATNTLQHSSNAMLKNLNFSASAVIGKDSIMLTSGNKAYIINPQTEQVINTLVAANNEVIIAISTQYFNNEKTIVIATKNTVYKFTKTDIALQNIYTLGQYSGDINSIYCNQNSHQIWVCTTQGLIKLTTTSNAVKTYFLPQNNIIGEDAVINIANATLGLEHYVTTASGSCFITDFNSSWKKIPINIPVNSVAVFDNTILLSTQNGLYKYDGISTKKIPLSNGYDNAFIKKIIVAQNNYWLLAKDKPVLVLQSKNFQPNPKYYITNNNIFEKENLWNDIIEDQYHQVFLAGWMPKGYGLAMYDTQQNCFIAISKRTKNQALFIGDYYNKLCTSKYFNLLFSGYGGFNNINKNGIATKIVSVDKYKIANEHAEGIAEMPDGKIWFATEEGLQVYNPATDQLNNVTTQNGLPSNNCTNAFTVLDTNIIALGFNKSLSIVNTDQIFNSILQNKLVLSSVKINDSAVATNTSSIVLQPNKRNVVLQFSALNFSDVKKLQYQYKINNNAWQALGSSPILTFANFKPGTYNITVRVADNTDNWQPTQLHFSIKALPYFYETVWFIVLIILIVGFGIWLLFRFRLAQIKRLNAFRQSISQDLHDDVGATLSSINILSSMLSTNGDLPTKPRSYVQRIHTDVQQLQLKLDEIIWSLKKEENSLHQIFSKLVTYGTFILGAKNIVFLPKADDGIENILLPIQQKRSIYLLVKEALNNIAKHSQATEATLQFGVKYMQLTITINDNGIGINNDKITQRNGITGMYKRAQEIKATININSNPNQGTTITITIKL